jgi:hypothetical protein
MAPSLTPTLSRFAGEGEKSSVAADRLSETALELPV